jgi:hypothetical protein
MPVVPRRPCDCSEGRRTGVPIEGLFEVHPTLAGYRRPPTWPPTTPTFCASQQRVPAAVRPLLCSRVTMA